MHNPLEQFELHRLVTLNLAGYDVSITNSAVVMIMALVVSVLLLGIGRGKLALIPTRMQAFRESIYELITDLVASTAGPDAKRFEPFVFSLFMFILMCNLLGMIPFSFTPTSHIAVTFALAIVVFLGVTIIGFARHGLHYFSLFLPDGVPPIMAPFMIFIEFFAYLIRPVSLSLRLAANMTAGHIVMKVIASFVVLLAGVSSVFPFALLVVLTGFELFVAILQAYIFTILTCIYLTDAIKLH